MLNLGIIEPSKSSWSSLIVMVHKKDGHVHLCGNYRKVNKVTADDGYYILRPDELIDRMSNAKYISTLDIIIYLHPGYHQKNLTMCQ